MGQNGHFFYHLDDFLDLFLSTYFEKKEILFIQYFTVQNDLDSYLDLLNAHL